MNKRNKILVVDKKSNYSSLFQGFRKNKFTIENLDSVLKMANDELVTFNLFFVVLYETRDVFELLKIYNGSTPIIVASENSRILKKMKNLSCLPLLDLSLKGNTTIKLHECIKDVFV